MGFRASGLWGSVLAAAGSDTIARMDPVIETNLPLPGRHQGKVRDTYSLPAQADGEAGERLLIVATDRISAFDVVLPTAIPGKGRLLNDVSGRWFRWIENQGLARTFLLSTEAADVPGLTDEQRLIIEGRASIGRRCQVVPIECVARGYLVGSGWGEYEKSGEVCGITLPAGLRKADRLPAPIFTPATKAAQGEHDENITFEQACDRVGTPVMERLRELTLAIYVAAADYARSRGLIIADTKFEFGAPVGEPMSAENLILIDEALTPDSSRFWPLEGWSPGAEPPSFDKQFVRNHLLGLVARGEWDKRTPGPALPAEIVEKTQERYQRARSLLFPDSG